MSYSESQVISRLLKVGKALTSYQECPKCRQKVEKDEINLINEKITKHPVSQITHKEFFHLTCFSAKQYLLAQNRNIPAEEIPGFDSLNPIDQPRFLKQIALLKSQLQSAASLSANDIIAINTRKPSPNKIDHYLSIIKPTKLISNSSPSPSIRSSTNSSISTAAATTTTNTTTQMKHPSTLLPNKQLQQMNPDELSFNGLQSTLARMRLQQQMQSVVAEKRKYPAQLDQDVVNLSTEIEPKNQKKLKKDFDEIQNFMMSTTTTNKSEWIRSAMHAHSKQKSLLELSQQQQLPLKSEKTSSSISAKQSKPVQEQQSPKGKHNGEIQKEKNKEKLIDPKKPSKLKKGLNSSSTTLSRAEIIEQLELKLSDSESDPIIIPKKSQTPLDPLNSSSKLYPINLATMTSTTTNESNPFKSINRSSNYDEIAFDKSNSRKVNEAKDENKLFMNNTMTKLSNDQMPQKVEQNNQFAFTKLFKIVNYDADEGDEKEEEDDEEEEQKDMLRIRNAVAKLQKSSQQHIGQKELIRSETSQNISQHQPHRIGGSYSSNSLSHGARAESLIRRDDSSIAIDSLSREELLAELKRNGYVNLLHLTTTWLAGMVKDGRKSGSIPPCRVCRVGQLVFNPVREEYFCNNENGKCRIVFSANEIWRKTWVN